MVELLKHIPRVGAQLVMIAITCMALVSCSTQQRLGVVATSDAASGPAGSDGARYETKQVAVPAAVKSLLVSAEQAISQGRLEEAKNLLARAQRIAPSYSRSYLLWGVLHRLEGDESKATQMFNRAYSLAANDSEKRAVLKAQEDSNAWH